MDKEKEPRKPDDDKDPRETTEANEELNEKFNGDNEDKGLPANRVGGLRGNPS